MAIEDRKYREKQQRYNSILDAAEKIMQLNGVSNLNMDLVAKETELAKGTLYLYFKSKEEILAALSIKSRNLLLTHFKTSTENIDNPIEQLKAIAHASFDFFKKHPFYFELIAIYEVINKLENTEEIQQSVNNLVYFVNGIAIKAKEQNLLNPNIEPMQYTFCLWGVLMGMTQLIKVRGDAMQGYLGFTEQDIINTFMIQMEGGMKR